MEPERKIEKLLRAYAKKHRGDAGEPLKLHPATRRLLQGEVSRRKPQPETEETSLSLWQLFRQQWAFLTGFALLIFLGAVLLLPALSTAKHKAQNIGAMNHLQQIGIAAKMAAEENNGQLPASLDALTNGLLSEQALSDPASGKPFIYVAGGENLDSLQSNDVLAYSPENKKDRAVLFADGRVEYVNGARLSEMTNLEHVQVALADKTARKEIAAVGAARPVAATMSPLPEKPASGATYAETGASQLLAQTGAVTNQPNLFRNEAVSAQTVPVLQSFQLVQRGDTISVVDRDGSVYRGSMQFAAAPIQNEPAAAVEAPQKEAVPLQSRAKEAQPAGNQQQAVQNYFFRVTGTNQTLKQRVVFSGNVEMSPNAQQTFSGGSNGGIQAAQNNSQPVNSQQLRQMSNFHIVGTAVIGRTNRISVSAVPVMP